MDRLDNEREHGKKISSNAEEVWGWASPAGRLRADRRAKYLYTLGNWKPGDKLLEIGCGTGLFTEKVYKASGATIIATDISEDLLEVARQQHPGIEFKVDDAMNISFPANSFDGVYGSSIIHHLDLKKSMEEIMRVLKPGGRTVFAEPNMLNPQIFIQKNVPFIKRALGDSPDETAIVRWRMKRMMQDMGFVNVRIFPYDFLHPYTPTLAIPVVNAIGRFVEKIPVLKEIAGSVIIYGEKPR
jgi:ubiquinone/menaquinone biosynthesis C-methylase UbiE